MAERPKVYAIDGVTPVVHPTAYVHPSAVLIGDVVVGPRCYIGPLASLRGDFGRILIGEGANVQDTCVMHAFPGMDAVIEEDGHIGHGAVIQFGTSSSGPPAGSPEKPVTVFTSSWSASVMASRNSVSAVSARSSSGCSGLLWVASALTRRSCSSRSARSVSLASSSASNASRSVWSCPG